MELFKTLYSLYRKEYSGYTKEIHAKTLWFLLLNDNIEKSNIEIIVEVRLSYGWGDLSNAIKTCFILSSIGYQTKLLTFSPDLAVVDEYLSLSPYKDKIEMITEKDINSDHRNKKRIVISVAVDRVCPNRLVHADTYIFIDEYNGDSVGRLEEKDITNTLNTNRIRMTAGMYTNPNLQPCLGLLFSPLTIPFVGESDFFLAYNSDKDGIYDMSTLVRYLYTILLIESSPIFYVIGTPLEKIKEIDFQPLGATLISEDHFEKKNGELISALLLYKRKEGSFTIEWRSIIEPQLFRSAIRHSKEPLLLTGDQSLTEGIEDNKLFFYQLHSWKVRLYNSILAIIHWTFPRASYPSPDIGSMSSLYQIYNTCKRFSPFLTFFRLCTGVKNSTTGTKPRISYRSIFKESSLLANLLLTEWKTIHEHKTKVYHRIKKYYDMTTYIDPLLMSCLISEDKRSELQAKAISILANE